MTDSRQLAPVSQDPLVGQVFEGKYEILAVLGQGGMGVVYKALHLQLNKLVAIKTLVPGTYMDDRSFLRFQQEARSASALTHPNIIAIFDFGVSTSGLAFLVMEFLSGRTLEDVILSEGTLPPARFEKVFHQVCAGIHHAHKRGLVHRDIKPSNIMLVKDEDGEEIAKILDFGLAKGGGTEQSQNLTRSGVVVGSPPFMSPEQCKGEQLDARSDIYSLGCVMYAALTGEVPFLGENTMSTLFKHVTDVPRPLSECAPGLRVPPSVEAVIMRTLEKDRNLRQQSMADLDKELGQAIEEARSGRASYASLPVRQRTDMQTGGKETEDKTRLGIPSASAPSRAPGPEPIPSTAEQSRPLVSRSRQAEAPPPAPDSAPTDSAVKNKTGNPTPIIVAVVLALTGGAIGSWYLTRTSTQPAAVIPSASQSGAAVATGAVSPPVQPSQQGNPRPASATEQRQQQSTSSTPGAPQGVATQSETTTSKTAQRETAASSPTKEATLAKSTAPKPKPQPQDNHTATAKLAKVPVKSPTPAQTSTQHKPVALPIKAADSNGPAQTARAQGAQAEQLAAGFRAQGDDAMNKGNFHLARENYRDCLNQQKRFKSANDPSLLITIALLIAAHHRAEMRQAGPEVAEALAIYSSRKQAAIQKLNAQPQASLLWKSIATACYELGKQADSVNSHHSYMVWAETFFQHAVATWNGRVEDPAYAKLLRPYMTAASEARDFQTVAQLRRQLIAAGHTVGFGGQRPGVGAKGPMGDGQEQEGGGRFPGGGQFSGGRGQGLGRDGQEPVGAPQGPGGRLMERFGQSRNTQQQPGSRFWRRRMPQQQSQEGYYRRQGEN